MRHASRLWSQHRWRLATRSFGLHHPTKVRTFRGKWDKGHFSGLHHQARSQICSWGHFLQPQLLPLLERFLRHRPHQGPRHDYPVILSTPSHILVTLPHGVGRRVTYPLVYIPIPIVLGAG